MPYRLAFLLLLMLPPASARADVIYDSFGPGNSFAPTFIVIGPDISQGAVGVSFRFVAQNTVPLYVDAISFAAGRRAGGTTPAFPSVYVGDVIPGAVPGNPGLAIGGAVAPSVAPVVVTAVLQPSSGAILPGHSYWFTIFGSAVALNAALNPAGTTGAAVEFVSGKPLTPGTATLPAFRIEGTTAVPPGVPEPGPLLLGGAGLAAAALTRRLRPRQ